MNDFLLMLGGAVFAMVISGIVNYKKSQWVGLMRGVRVEGDTLVITVKGGNDAARELCGALIEEMNK